MAGPLDRCYAFLHPVFQPAMRIISAITNSNPATITTTFAHNYISGTIVRLDIPFADGMYQANQLTGAITVTAPTQFTIPIDTTAFSPFSIPANPAQNAQICALVVPIGEVSSMLDAAVQNVLPLT